MDILTHTLSGFAVGTVITSFSKRGLKEKSLIFGIGGFAGALPDIDAISLWSGFDSTFGQVFNLSHSGREIYSAKFWYSHHAFMHSIAAALLISAVIGILIYVIGVRFRKFQLHGIVESFKRNRLLIFSFILGFLVHLLEDMPTPASSWGGVNLFWPLNSYVGGYGAIWWWNNYDLFIIVLSVMTINLTLLGFSRIRKNMRSKIIVGVFILGFLFAIVQIKTRNFDFAYSVSTKSYHEFELKSKKLQREILGDRLFKRMKDFDNKLKIHF